MTRDADPTARTDRHDPTARTDTGDAGAGTGTLADVSHTHPETGRTFGGNFTFTRGGAVAADGGRSDAVPDEEDADTLEDVEHTPPNESDDANRVFERGEEGRDGEDVAEDE